MAFVNDFENRRTVDVERNIILRAPTAGPERSVFFELEMEDEVVKFMATYELHRTGEKHKDRNVCNINWRIVQTSIPESMKDKKDEIWGIVREALDVYGFGHQKNDINEVSITVSPKLL